jgi:8-oxo-dGTP pyrophosphatase MutT (NUDIX family)
MKPTMSREDLIDALERHQPADVPETRARTALLRFVREVPDCFCRTHAPGHVTGSAWLLDRTGRRVLLTRHRKLNMWLQLGGHADGDSNVLQVALREAAEESGLDGITAVERAIFDVDVHPIPAREHEPAHLHYDIRYLLQADGHDVFVVSDESHALGWFTPEALDALPVDDSVRRMQRKWMAWLAGGERPWS